MTLSIVDFLNARLAEDEETARAAIDPDRPGTHWQWVTTETDTPVAVGDIAEAQEHQKISLRTVEHREYPPETGYGSLPAFLISYAEEVEPGAGEHIARHDPARVLREVEAKRSIVEQYEGYVKERTRLMNGWPNIEIPPFMLALAAVYSDHPDYRTEWSTT